ncbi:MAG TPA: thioredoxin family protein [Acidimicrobiia bacterium]|nr:thioredoxin family protein [Acidimicrobiia bacterium]
MAVESTMLALGTGAPSFELPALTGETVKLEDFEGAPGLLVMFICNHCPYVKHVEKELASLVAEYQARGLAAVGICSNDVDQEPEDTPEGLREQVERAGFSFPYLIDETQEVGHAYRAACTPDFFLFDADQKLAYRGQMDSSRPKNDEPVTGEDLRRAIDAVLNGEQPDAEQRPSMGCAISWKPGNEPG